MNNAYLTCGRDSASEEVLTPFYAVQIIKYLAKDERIWCPFDKKESAFATKRARL